MDAGDGVDHDVSHYVDVIARESAGFLDVLRSGPLANPVPGCPDWSLEDLGFHLAEVQSWATAVIRTGSPPEPNALPPPASDVVATMAAATESLLAGLDGLIPSDPCWNFCTTTPQTMAFWPRRQALEVAVHHWDARSATSDGPGPLDAGGGDLAIDVLHEYLTALLQRKVDREHIDVSGIDDQLTFSCTDADDDADDDADESPNDDAMACDLTIGVVDGAVELVPRPSVASERAVISGSADELALFVYGRLPPDAVRMVNVERLNGGWMRLFEL